MLVKLFQSLPHLKCRFLLGYVWYYMILDLVKDNVLGPRDRLLVPPLLLGLLEGVKEEEEHKQWEEVERKAGFHD